MHENAGLRNPGLLLLEVPPLVFDLDFNLLISNWHRGGEMSRQMRTFRAAFLRGEIISVIRFFFPL